MIIASDSSYSGHQEVKKPVRKAENELAYGIAIAIRYWEEYSIPTSSH